MDVPNLHLLSAHRSRFFFSNDWQLCTFCGMLNAGSSALLQQVSDLELVSLFPPWCVPHGNLWSKSSGTRKPLPRLFREDRAQVGVGLGFGKMWLSRCRDRSLQEHPPSGMSCPAPIHTCAYGVLLIEI